MANAIGFCRRCGKRIPMDKEHCDDYPNCKQCTWLGLPVYFTERLPDLKTPDEPIVLLCPPVDNKETK